MKTDTAPLICGILIGGLLMFAITTGQQTNQHGTTGRECRTSSSTPCDDSRDSCQQAHTPLKPMEQAQWLCLPTGHTNTN